MPKADLKPTVTLTSATVDKMSRHDMLEWVNNTVHGQHKKIEELCSGVAYCLMMELLFPNCIGAKRIKVNAKLEHEFLANLKLFQAAFIKLNIDKSVPIDRLMKGKFQDNFEFLQWFKKFFDTHSAGKENMKVPAALAAASQNAPKPIRKPGGGAPVAGAKTTGMKLDATYVKAPNGTQPQEEQQLPPSTLKTLQENKQKLEDTILSMEVERDQYYKKLMLIEAIVNQSLQEGQYTGLCNRALAILYATDDGATPADNEAQQIVEGVPVETEI